MRQVTTNRSEAKVVKRMRPSEQGHSTRQRNRANLPLPYWDEKEESMRGAALVLLLTIGLGSTASAANMTGDEIQQKLIGHQLKWKSEKFHGSGTTVYKSDGTFVINADGESKPHTGTWKIKGNEICATEDGKKKEDCGGPYDQVNDTTFYLFKYEAVVIVQP
jgi:hypothetical protein